jgi:phosphatidylglycerophosphate synthase
VRRFPPSVLSKVNTVIQVAAVVLVLISALWPALEPVASALVYGVALLTLASGLDYILRASRLSGQAGQPE